MARLAPCTLATIANVRHLWPQLATTTGGNLPTLHMHHFAATCFYGEAVAGTLTWRLVTHKVIDASLAAAVTHDIDFLKRDP